MGICIHVWRFDVILEVVLFSIQLFAAEEAFAPRLPVVQVVQLNYYVRIQISELPRNQLSKSDTAMMPMFANEHMCKFPMWQACKRQFDRALNRVWQGVWVQLCQMILCGPRSTTRTEVLVFVKDQIHAMPQPLRTDKREAIPKPAASKLSPPASQEHAASVRWLANGWLGRFRGRVLPLVVSVVAPVVAVMLKATAPTARMGSLTAPTARVGSLSSPAATT